MRQTLQNHRLKIEIDPVGAELASIVNVETGQEYMWQADPEVWGSHAPVLFPIIGVLKDGETHIDGQTYRIPKHGMVRPQRKPRTVLPRRRPRDVPDVLERGKPENLPL